MPFKGGDRGAPQSTSHPPLYSRFLFHDVICDVTIHLEELTEVLHITPTSLLKVLFIVVIVTFKIKGGHVVAKY